MKLKLLSRQPRTTYGCGNCRETFKTEAEMKAHQPCPLVVIEREVAEHNRDFLRAICEREGHDWFTVDVTRMGDSRYRFIDNCGRCGELTPVYAGDPIPSPPN